MLPFTGSKANTDTPKPAPTKPVVVVTVPTPAAKAVPATAKPVEPAPPIATVAKAEPPVAPPKKTKKAPPAVAINLVVPPSKKSPTSPASHPDAPVDSSTNNATQMPITPAQPFRLSDWIYDEKAHEQWRQKQLEETREKEPIHRYESAQLNQAFYNLILNEPVATPTTETAKP